MPSLELDGSPRSPSDARRFINSVVEPWGVTGDLLDTVRLLGTELVTNAMLHGAPPIRISLERRAGAIRVDVHDASPVQPVVRPFDPEAPTGHGILLVDRLARRWGVDAGDGKSVWFEVSFLPSGDVSEPASASSAAGPLDR